MTTWESAACLLLAARDVAVLPAVAVVVLDAVVLAAVSVETEAVESETVEAETEGELVVSQASLWIRQDELP